MNTAGARIRMRIRRDGILATLTGVIQAIRPQRYGIYCKELDRDEPADTSMLSNSRSCDWQLRRGLEELHSAVAGVPVGARPWAFRLDMEARSDYALFTCVNGHPNSILWVIDHSHLSKHFVLRADEAELASLYVCPEVRSRGIAKLLVEDACRQLRQTGMRRVYATIRYDNVASQKVFEACGFQKVAENVRPTALGPRFVSKVGASEGWFRFLFGKNLNFGK